MKFFFGLISLIALTVEANELCLPDKSVSEALATCLETGVEIISQMSSPEEDAESVLAAATLFLEHNKERTDFDLDSAQSLVIKIEKQAARSSLSAHEKSRLWLMSSGVHGRIADKLRANGGTEEGKLALSCIKKSLSFNKNNKEAAKAYATTIARFTERSFVVRKFIESGLEIKIGDEVKSAMKSMEAANITNDPLYQQLKDF